MSGLRSFVIGAGLVLSGCVSTPPAGTGDLGVVIERANGTVAVINTTDRRVMGEVPGLGDLSHASVVFSRDGLFAYVFGRDGALSKVNMLTRRIEARTQAPRLEVLTGQHYVNQGGCDAVVYKATPAEVESGVVVGDRFFRGFPVPGSPLVRIRAAPSPIRRKASPKFLAPHTNGTLKSILLMWKSSSAGVNTSDSSM